MGFLCSVVWLCGAATLAWLFLHAAAFAYVHGVRRPTDWRRFAGEWAVVTGASFGTGEAFARALFARGLNVVLVARSRDRLEAISRDLLASAGAGAGAAAGAGTPECRVRIVSGDFVKDGGAEAYEAVRRATEGLRVSVVVNNVGGGEPGMLPLDYWVDSHPNGEEVIRLTNSTPTITLTRMFLPQMIRNKKGRILNISSLSYSYSVLLANYGPEKAKINAFTTGICEEVRSHGVAVQAIMLGEVSTPATLNKSPSLHVCSATRLASNTLDKFGALGLSTLTPYWFHDLERIAVGAMPERLALFLFHSITLRLRDTVGKTRLMQQKKS
ncbi:3-ketoacyl-CoA reductase [Pelomyxa schiedti]|nr:3-ketoacyl-CoA reductase [Pelomyxa schiedti]